MTAPHFFAASVDGERVELSGEEARHAVRVLRIRPGEIVTLADGAGNVVRARVVGVGETVTADVVERWFDDAPRPAIHVFHAIPKSRKLDIVVQKLTELGVDSLQPFTGARSVATWDERKALAQVERLRAIARDAAKQSRRSRIPDVRVPSPLDALEMPSFSVVLDEEATTRMTSVLPEEPPEAIGIVIGPEGGLDRSEVSTLADRGARSVSLGPLVLRTETAGLAALAVVRVRYGLIG
jgi:16S rRNA (uracil1498-N3)-methyltransferase